MFEILMMAAIKFPELRSATSFGSNNDSDGVSIQVFEEGVIQDYVIDNLTKKVPIQTIQQAIPAVKKIDTSIAVMEFVDINRPLLFNSEGVIVRSKQFYYDFIKWIEVNHYDSNVSFTKMAAVLKTTYNVDQNIQKFDDGCDQVFKFPITTREWIASDQTIKDISQQQVIQSTQEWISILSILEKDFDITQNEKDFVPSAIIKQQLDNNGVKMSGKKIGMELVKLSLRNEAKKLSGRTVQVWHGIKKKSLIDGIPK